MRDPESHEFVEEATPKKDVLYSNACCAYMGLHADDQGYLRVKVPISTRLLRALLTSKEIRAQSAQYHDEFAPATANVVRYRWQ